jgi:2-C-methyl-D-erythritol 4-phosphate cytidylyltransferase
VLNGLREMATQCHESDWVMVHDAARPCLSPALIDRLIDALRDDPVGGILAIPVADTLKRADAAGRIEATVPRQHLWAAQTPQMFRLGLLIRALSQDSGVEVTDEASAVESLGLQPRLVPGDPINLKVTYPDDLRSAERHLVDLSGENITP